MKLLRAVRYWTENNGSGPRWRWSVATLANRVPSACWAHLVGWVFRDKGDRMLPALRGARWCQRNTANGSCYCGKVRAPELDAGCFGRPLRPVYGEEGRLR